MTDPTKDDGPAHRTATKEDVDSAKNEVLTAIRDTRDRSSQEHGSIITVVRDENKGTRAHVGSEIETVRGDVGHAKNFAERTLRAIKRFLNRHGMGTDDL